MASKINADEFVDREGEGKPTLPKGVVLSGVTTITTAVVAENEVANTGGISVGIITSTHFAGNLTGDVNAGIVTVTSQTVVGSAVTISASGIDIGAGVITATSYAGSGANLTGIGATIMVWEYNPDPYDTAVTFDTGIGITFNQKIKAGSGNITLSIANAGVAGTVVENFGIGNSVTITNNALSLTPTSDLSVEGGQYCITLPSGVITNMAGESYVGTAYTFETRKYSYQLWGLGNNTTGNLGQNSQTHYSSPVQVPGTNWEHLYDTNGRVDHVTVVKSDGTLWSWGYNSTGGLGFNDTANRSSPTQLPGTTWRAGAHNEHNTMATKSDGTLWMMGRNIGGVLGINLNPSQRTGGSSPVQVPGTTWSNDPDKNAMIDSSAAAIKTDGTLWTWGDSGDGSLGLNDTGRWPGRNNSRSSPTEIHGGGTTWKQVDGGYSAFAAVKTDGTLWIWGQNIWGQLGQNEAGSHPAYNTSRSSPTQIPGTNWNQASGGGSGGARWYATKTDGTLWGWGKNDYGQLGDNSTVPRSSPVQVPGTTWSEVESVTTGARGLKTDGTLWGWGRNNYGDLGQNNTTAYSSPVQLPGTDWYKAMGQMLQKRV